MCDTFWKIVSLMSAPTRSRLIRWFTAALAGNLEPQRAAALALLACALSPVLCQGAQIIQSDICVYGGTSGGVSAAVAAARLGKNGVLGTYNNHVRGRSEDHTSELPS